MATGPEEIPESTVALQSERRKTNPEAVKKFGIERNPAACLRGIDLAGVTVTATVRERLSVDFFAARLLRLQVSLGARQVQPLVY
jgi:hypothetical protein